MTRLRVDVGTKLTREGTRCLIIDIDSNGFVTLEEVQTGKRSSIPRSCLEKELLNGITVYYDPVSELKEVSSSPLDMLPPDVLAIVRRRQSYVEALSEQSANCSVTSIIETTKNKIAIQLGDGRAPSNSSLFRWLGNWEDAGKSPTALIPAYRNRGHPKREITIEVIEIIEEEIREHYWKREQPTLKYAYNKMQQRFDAENEKRTVVNKLDLPSFTTVFRIEKDMDAYERMVARKGKLAADRFFKPVLASLKAEAPLDLVQIDHTILDIHVLAPVSGWVARPRITVALDTYSRMPIGIYLGFVSAGYESLMLCLRQGIVSKEEFILSFSSINGDWPCLGLPRKILVDNGLEFHSNSLRDACAHLGISIVNHPVREPRYKGAVERFFRTINQSLITSLKGKTFSNPQERGDYNSVKQACIPFDVFEEALYKWVVDVYARTFHRGIDAVPLEKWQEGVAKYPVDLPANPNDLHALLSEKETRKLTNAGIEMHNARYNSLELNQYFVSLGEERDVVVKRDPQDLGSVFVFLEEHSRFITVPCTTAPLQGVSLWQYKIARKAVAEKRKKAVETYDPAQEIRDLWAFIEAKSDDRKPKSNARVARFAEYQTNKAEESKPDGAPLSMDASVEEPDFDYDDLIDDARTSGWDSDQMGEDE